MNEPKSVSLKEMLEPNGPNCLIVRAKLKPVGDVDRFQPAGFPQVGHVLYDAPRGNDRTEKVCIIDSPASMANHLESVCMAGPNDHVLHEDLKGLPYVVCFTDSEYKTEGSKIILDPKDPHNKAVVTSLTEGHRIASDYFLDGFLSQKWEEERPAAEKTQGKKPKAVVPGHWTGKTVRDQLREEFRIKEVVKDKTYFLHPEDWWNVYKTVFKYDPNSLVHGVMFAKEQIKISRILSAHLEALGAARVPRSGVKFDRLGKTVSGQPIFSVDEETAYEIRGTFIFDLGLLRSYGRDEHGLADDEKRLLLELGLWKVKRLLDKPFRYRTQCYLGCYETEMSTETERISIEGTPDLLKVPIAIQQWIEKCGRAREPVTKAYYPADKLFKLPEPSTPEAEEAGALGEDEEEEASED